MKYGLPQENGLVVVDILISFSQLPIFQTPQHITPKLKPVSKAEPIKSAFSTPEVGHNPDIKVSTQQQYQAPNQ